ncbi:type IV secretory system conjugative DNA transfer family protein [Conexibacter sp. DBS9H8]|uniref:type IV secretory system conjugative DNA transfer family protein n=1 Tax=Conexibacter sp. DBS9H8 TaxID=2937801 RepID=UPI00200ED90F|nr:type IV secretory system conjugative DNA transfer family protein [Conexibacter sp. DBS9H8]
MSLPLLLIAAALAAVAWRTDPVRPRRADSARWATGAELAPLRTRARARAAGRLGLGRHHGRTLRAEARHALIAFGPPQSGKSAGLAIPALLEWEGPALASSIKTDLWTATHTRRSALASGCAGHPGRVFVFDPFALSGVHSHTWSPLRTADRWEGALEVAWRLAAAGELDQRGTEGGEFWAVAAEQRLAPLLFCAAAGGLGIEDVLSWAYGQGARDLERILERLAGEGHDPACRADAREAYEAVRGFQAQADRTRTSIEATVQALLRAYRFPRVARSAAGSEITPERLLEGASTLYLIGDPKASKLLRPIFTALVAEVVDAAYARANAHGGRLPLPLLLCLDEAGNVAPIPNLAEVASTAPSHNIQLVSIFHDLQQARARYGGQAETVVNSHRARMLLPGVADMETLRYFSALVGDTDVPETTRSRGREGVSTSMGRRRVPLLAADALRRLREGEALLLYGRLAPVRLRLRRYYADRRLRRLAATGDRHHPTEGDDHAVSA